MTCWKTGAATAPPKMVVSGRSMTTIIDSTGALAGAKPTKLAL